MDVCKLYVCLFVLTIHSARGGALAVLHIIDCNLETAVFIFLYTSRTVKLKYLNDSWAKPYSIWRY